MSGADFLDTNVFVYAYQFNDRHKQKIAHELVEAAVAGKFVISVQVLSEFASTLLHKMSATPHDVTDILDKFSPIKLVVSDRELVRRAVEARAAYGIHFYDGMIVASAERAGCQRILSEDLNAGQQYFGVTVMNPFS
jgi:predicted nucleic acid-binding protein